MTKLEKIALVIDGIEAIGMLMLGLGLYKFLDYAVMREEGCSFREYAKKVKNGEIDAETE